MRLLIAVPAQHPATGNWATARRFRESLQKGGHTVSLVSPPFERQSLPEADLVLLIHATKTALPWFDLCDRPEIPTLLFLAGTDINEEFHDPRRQSLILDVARAVDGLLYQSEVMAQELLTHAPELRASLHRLPAALSLGNAPYDLRRKHALPSEGLLLLCPAGIRPVKAVLELLECFDPLVPQAPPFHLAFCGPCLDEVYAGQFFREIEQRPWASYLGVIPAEAMPAAMKQADVVLNNSVSESLSHALLEADSLGIPILARENPGNRAVVREGENGLLYRDLRAFEEKALRLLRSPELRAKLGHPLPGRYDAGLEAQQLERVARQLLG